MPQECPICHKKVHRGNHLVTSPCVANLNHRKANEEGYERTYSRPLVKLCEQYGIEVRLIATSFKDGKMIDQTWVPEWVVELHMCVAHIGLSAVQAILRWGLDEKLRAATMTMLHAGSREEVAAFFSEIECQRCHGSGYSVLNRTKPEFSVRCSHCKGQGHTWGL